MGYFPKEALKESFRRINGMLQGHPDMNKTPGIDMTTGSLGIGLSVGCGMAFGARILGKDFRVYVLTGDGELNEGQVWEAAKTAAHHRLDNLTVIVDANGYQNDGPTRVEMDMEPLAEKWRAFGWSVQEVDGHSIEQLSSAFDQVPAPSGRPTAIICRTVKCKGVSFMEEDKVKCPGTLPMESSSLRRCQSSVVREV